MPLSPSIVDTVGQFGLTAGIAIYLIYFVTKELKECIQELTDSIKELCDKLDKNNSKLNNLCYNVDEMRKKLN